MDTVTLNQEENMVPEYEYKHVQEKAVKLLKENLYLKAEVKYLEAKLDGNSELAQDAYDNMMDIQSIIDGEL